MAVCSGQKIAFALLALVVVFGLATEFAMVTDCALLRYACVVFVIVVEWLFDFLLVVVGELVRLKSFVKVPTRRNLPFRRPYFSL